LDDVTRLVRQRAPWTGPSTATEQLAGEDAVVLLEGKFDAAFAYGRVMPDATLSWSEAWNGEYGLPRYVRLILSDRATGREFGGDMTFLLRADAPARCAETEAGLDCLDGASKKQASSQAEIERTGRGNQ
jgi:hypothetical protein